MNPANTELAKALLSGSIIDLRLRSDRKKRPTLYGFRRMTREEVFTLVQGRTYPYDPGDGSVINVKVTSVHRWERDPERLEVRVKWGMRDYFTLTANECTQVLLVPL